MVIQSIQSMASDVVTFDNLFTDEEMCALWTRVEQSEWNSRPFSHTSTFKNGKILAPELAKMIFEKCAANINSIYTDATNTSWTPVGACDHIFFAEVQSGQQFGLHTDTGSVYDQHLGHYSKFTVLIYLNDSTTTECTECTEYIQANDFQGGMTTFIESQN